MSSAFYIFRLVWPFLKELVLGGVTLKEGMRTQRRRVFLLFFVSGLIFALFLIIPRFYALSQEHVKLEKSVEAANVHRMEERINDLERQVAAKPVISVAPVAVPPETLVSAPASPEHNVALYKTNHPAHTRANNNDAASGPDQASSEAVAARRKKAYMDFFDKYDD